MPVGSHIEVVGVKETIKALRQLDPEHRKEFNKGIKAVVAPMVAAAKGAYPAMPLSGMTRQWAPAGRQLFPWVPGAVRTGVKVKTSTRRDKNTVVYVTQATPAGSIFEVVGTGKPLGAHIRARSERVLWPTYDRFAGQIQQGVGDIVQRAEATVQGRLA